MNAQVTGLAGFVLQHGRLAPSRTAVETGARRITYAELLALVDGLAAALVGRGLQRGQLVVLSADDELALVVGALATVAAGGVFTVLRRALRDSASTATIRAMKPAFMLADGAHHGVPGVGTVVFDPERLPLATGASRVLDSTAALDDAEHPCCLIIGSGSTGTPKMFMVSQAQEIAHLRTRMAAYGLHPDDRAAHLSHAEFASARRYLFAALAAGATVKLRSIGQTDWPQRTMFGDATVVHTPVVTLHALVQSFGGQRGVLRDARILGVGGSEVSESLRQATDRTLCSQLHIAYGTNELGILTMASPDAWKRHPGTIGHPIAGIEMEVVGREGTPVQVGEPGLLRFRRAFMMSAYLGAPEQTRRSFRDGWFYPQDIGRVDDSGLVQFLGRADDLMIFNGINIYPAEIERVMRAAPGVVDVAAFPARHPVHQDVPVCALALDGSSAMDGAGYLAWARARLGPLAPRKVVIVDSIPRNEQGKLLRPALRDMLAGGVKEP